MRLLFDENLSPRLCELLQDVGDTVAHVSHFGLQQADDAAVRTHAVEHDFVIVTKDGDFNNLAFLFGAPPKVVWIRLGNCSTTDVERLLRTNRATMAAFVADSTSVVLILE